MFNIRGKGLYRICIYVKYVYIYNMYTVYKLYSNTYIYIYKSCIYIYVYIYIVQTSNICIYI